MKKIASKVTKSGYRKVVKPLLFKRKPDTVHNQLIKLAKLVGGVPGVRSLPRVWGYQNSQYLEQTVAGMVFRNPVGLSAGFDKGIVTPRIMRAVGFGFMTGGSVTWGAYEGNEGDWFYRLPKSESLVVNAGLPSEGTEHVLGRISGFPASVFSKFPLIVSVAKTNSPKSVSDQDGIRDYVASMALLNGNRNVHGMEINISCPNTFGGEPFTTPKRLDMLLTAVDSLMLETPVFIKMPISMSLPAFRKLIDIVAAHNVAGVTIGNLRKDRDNAELKDELPASVKGGLSGAPCRDISTRLVRDTYERHGSKLIIIGVGGVFTAEHAYEKIRAGATLVEMVTGLIFEGPQVVGEINRELVQLLKRDGYGNVQEAIGADVRK